MEPRDLVGSARPKEAELQGGRVGPNEEDQERAGAVGLARSDDVITGGISEGEGLEEQGEGLLEEQEFSIKEASFQEGSLKLKIQTTKRTKKPPKNLENYICPPEIRMTIRPPVGEGKGGRQGRAGSGAGRGQKDEERGPPRKRTYERQFRMPEQREGGLLQLLGDHTPPKHQLRSSLPPAHTHSHTQQTQHALTQQFQHAHAHQHQISPDWITSTAPSASPANPAHPEPARELAGAGGSALLDPTQPFSRTATQSPSPQRSLTPDLQLPVVTDASILNLTSLSRGRGLQEVSEQLFGNIKRKYGRKDSQRMLCNPHSADTPWGRQPEKGSESPTNSEERQKYRQEETAERFHEEREERRKEERERAGAGRRGDEEDRGMPMLTEEGKGRKRRRRPSFDESFSVEERLQQRQDSDTTEKHQPGPPEPKVAHKMETHKNDSRLTSHADVSRERIEKAERADKGDKREKGERVDRAERGETVISGSDLESTNRMKKNPVGRPKTSIDTLKHRGPTHNHINKANLNTNPRLPSPNPSPSPRASISPSSSPKPRANISPSLSPGPRAALSPSPSHSTSSTASSRPTKAKDRWSYLKAKSHASLTSPQRDNRGSPSTLADPPSAFPITPSSPLYTNTDSLTVLTPIKRKRGRPKKQPLLTVETIHEGTSTSPPSPLAQETAAGLNRRRKTHALNTLVQMASSTTTSANSNSLKLKRGKVPSRPVNKMKLGKMQSILNEILSGSSQNGTLALKSSSAPVTSAMSAMASTIEARLGKQINVSKRGTIYIGKKRGRKPRAETQGSNPPKTTKDKPPLSVSTSSLYESPVVPSATLSPSSSAPSIRTSHSDATMPSLQPISALPSKPPGRSFLSGGWKLSPPRLLANSPSHLSEGASVKEVTLSPISESHSEETIPSDSGIGTDNNSTSDQTEKGPASRRRYSFDLCGFESAEAAALEASNRGSRARCERQVTAVDNFLSQQEKKQKHHRRKRKCLQSRDHLHFLSELEEVVVKLQQLRVSHRRYTCYPQQPYPSIFRLNFHHYYPVTYDSYPCDSSSYLRRSADLKAKRRRGRPAKASEPITTKLPFVQGYGYPLAGGNYYAAPYAMPYAPPLSLGYFPPAAPFYLPHHSLGPAPPSPFMRPAVPPPKAFHSSGHSKLQPGAKLRSASGPLQGPSVRGDGLGSLGSGSAGGLAGVRLHKRKHKHKHKHKDEPLLSLRDRQELGGLFSGAKTNARLSMLSDRRDLASQGQHLEKQRASGRGSSLGSSLGMFESDQLSTHSLSDSQFHARQTRQPINSFMSSYSSQSQRSESVSDLFLGSREDEFGGRSRKTRLTVFGDQGLMSFQTARQEPGQMTNCSSPSLTDVPTKRRYKRREVEQIQKDVRRMHSLNFEHVQKILRAKRLQRQAKTGNNVVKRRPGRPRKQPVEESEPTNRRVESRADGRSLDMLAGRRVDGRTLGMPVLERCDDLPGRLSLRPSLTPEPLEFSNHDSISATIETVVHQARSVPPLAKGGKRRGRGHSRDELWAPSGQ
ncbi:SET-binding protein [Sebastes umbrosus]|uniref:SET-binding protein n=1 Tax=Sebastes umbrosus TaxID=72105 RepID=UPI00189DBE13|nr:SET-binding protein [Sebastes umbrosus]XP_037632846.1 SET-binding protein [Sebastes umbrosus]XP_037632847.1 SET-binding protein [Sebastes umbrosus]